MDGGKRIEVDGIAEGHGYAIRLFWTQIYSKLNTRIFDLNERRWSESIFFVFRTPSTHRRLRLRSCNQINDEKIYYRHVIIMIPFYFDQYGFYSHFYGFICCKSVIGKPNSSSSKASRLQDFQATERLRQYTRAYIVCYVSENKL